MTKCTFINMKFNKLKQLINCVYFSLFLSSSPFLSILIIQSTLIIFYNNDMLWCCLLISLSYNYECLVLRITDTTKMYHSQKSARQSMFDCGVCNKSLENALEMHDSFA